MGFAQGRGEQIRIVGVSLATGKGHFTAMGGQALRTQRENHLRLGLIGQGHQHTGLGPLSAQPPRAILGQPFCQLFKHPPLLSALLYHTRARNHRRVRG